MMPYFGIVYVAVFWSCIWCCFLELLTVPYFGAIYSTVFWSHIWHHILELYMAPYFGAISGAIFWIKAPRRTEALKAEALEAPGERVSKGNKAP